MNERTRVLDGLSLLAGIWLVIAPFILNYNSSGNLWQEFIFGIAVVTLSLARLATPHVSWPSWANVLIGLWIILAPWVISSTTTAARWNEFMTGLIILILGFSSAASTENRQRMVHQ